MDLVAAVQVRQVDRRVGQLGREQVQASTAEVLAAPFLPLVLTVIPLAELLKRVVEMVL